MTTMDMTASTSGETTSSLPHDAPAGSPLDSSSPGAESLIAPTVEPSVHESTKVEVTQLKDPEVKDFGWNSKPEAVPSPLIKGLSNEDLYTLIRRFNKQIFHVKAVEEAPGLLDLQISEDEEFSPDKLRATLERLYMTVIVGIAGFVKHIARLRAWNEPRRTIGFCLTYYIAWWFKMILPLLFTTLMLLIIDPPSHKLLFPPAPLAIVSSKTGNLQTPKAGELGSKDSLSGAPETHRGEAVEQEARHFVSGLASVAMSTAAGKGPGNDGNGNTIGGGEDEAQGGQKSPSAIEGAVPDPTAMATGVTEAKDLASGNVTAEDPAKKPVESAIWDKARPIMRGISDAIDMWERFGNAITPTSPFPVWTSRLRLAAPLMPIVFLTVIMKTAIVIRVSTFLFGVIFFSQPALIKAAHWLTQRYPNWRQYLDLNKTLLIGIPTNAQLTLTLLRIAEHNKSPLPPPPTSQEPAPMDKEDAADSFDESGYEVDTGSDADADTMQQDDINIPEADSDEQKRKPGRVIASVLKRTVKAGVGGVLGVDHLKAKVGSESARQRLGAVEEPSPDVLVQQGTSGGSSKIDVARLHLPGGEGPSVFSGRMHGKKGNILLVTSAISPCVAFGYSKTNRSVVRSLLPGRSGDDQVDVQLKPEFTIGLHDVVELKKVGGFGWKTKMVVGWALGREVVDGLEITDRDGNKHLLTAIKGRDELFNRLLAVGGQKWECW